MLRKYLHLLAFAVLFAGTAFPQITKVFSPIERADQMYKNGEYYRAIPIYKREAKSKNPAKKQAAYVKLGNCYKATNDYALAEDAYMRASESGGDIEPEVFYNYAQILKTNNKYEEAAEQYENYLKLSPNDELAKKAKKFCKEIKIYLSSPIEYTVSNIAMINTEKSEFSPYVMNNKLMFIAERANFDFVSYEVNDYDGQPYMNMYVSAMNGDQVKKEKPFSKNINTQYHDGPGCLSPDGMMLYFTRASYVNKKNYVNQARIFTAVSSEKSWKKIKPLELNSDDYSVAHPSISADNNTLFFTSNMPGGFGGKDIWVSTREGDVWGIPVNLGPDINTTGDEMFPSIRKDSTLFFSSNGLPGFGGLDIYSAKLNQGKWILQRNEGLDINSSADDFGVTFLNDSVGYFSSNRAGGKGHDDIYKYEYRKAKSMVISGSVLLTENIDDKAKGKKVVLLDENGIALDSTNTDDKGYFEFKNLDPDKKYMTSIDEDDPELSGKARFYLADNDSTIHRVTGKYKDNRFVFKNLPLDPNGLPEMYTEDDLVFAGTLVQNDKEAIKNVKLKLVNDFGDVVEETTTNEFGAFAFRNIPSDQNYLVSVDEGDISLPEGTKITLNNKVGKEVRSFYKGKGNFTFKVLNTDQVLLNEMDAEDASLSMGIYGYMYDQDKKPLVNIKVHVKDEDGTNPRDWVTGENGKFNFEDLRADKNYILETDENDPNLKGVERIYIADNKGRVYKIVDLSSGKFSFKIVEADKFSLGEFVVSDPWLKVNDPKKAALAGGKTGKGKKEAREMEPEEESELSITIVENIYYPYGVWEIDDSGKAILDRAVDALMDYPKLVMEISSHTDSQSSSEFNMGLSKKRAQTAVDYVVSKGIDPLRLKAKGYGETKLLNKCEDGVECSDDEHKINRRTEFKITKPIKR